MIVPRLIIAGTHSGVGKTTVTLAILAALRVRGRRVQSFKVGPDFIDPSHHAAVTGRPSRNLDGWMLGADVNRGIFKRAATDADLSHHRRDDGPVRRQFTGERDRQHG